jgi:4-amino-4-deoxy-L-arabinose transferase-like glycosyltransferase
MPKRLLLIWLCFIFRGVFYCSFLPLWEGFDEWAHFAVAQRMSASSSLLIPRDSLVSRDIDVSLDLTPLPKGMTNMPPAGVTHEQYPDLPPQERSRREMELATLPPEWATEYPEDGEDGMPAYEASQAPLYYWLMAAPLSVIRAMSLVDRVWLIRVLTLLVGSLCIPLGFLVALRFFGESTAQRLTTIVALLPELALTLSRVSNESLAVVIYTLMILAAVGWIDRPVIHRAVAVGVFLGLGLLTKAYFLTALPALILIALWVAFKDPKRLRPVCTQVFLAIAIAAGISAWWYLRTYSETGTVSGLDEALMLRETGFMEKLGAVANVNWFAAIAVILLSHVWYGGWSLLALPRWIYVLWLGVMAGAVLGFAKAARSSLDSRAGLLLSLYAFFWLGQAYQIVMLFLSKGTSTAMGGWYLYCVIWAEVILATIGLRALIPARWHSYGFVILLVALAVTDLYGVHVVYAPYYAYTESLWSVDLSRLLMNKSGFLVSGGLALLYALYVLSTATLVVAGWRTVRTHTNREAGTL